MTRKGRTVFATLFLLVLSACKEPLYSDLGEHEANKMMALLINSNIAVKRERDKDGKYAILVEKAMLAQAVGILVENGLPKKRYTSLGETFEPQGIVSTPFEQRARFIHAMNDELAETIAGIEGVRDARVHIMLPEVDRFDRISSGARASVAIYHEANTDLSANISKIKEIVANSVQNLNYDDVTLAMFEAESKEPSMALPDELAQPQQSSVLSDLFSPESPATLFLILGLLLSFLFLLRSYLVLFLRALFEGRSNGK